jgi:hypothetical protein
MARWGDARWPVCGDTSVLRNEGQSLGCLAFPLSRRLDAVVTLLALQWLRLTAGTPARVCVKHRVDWLIIHSSLGTYSLHIAAVNFRTTSTRLSHELIPS